MQINSCPITVEREWKGWLHGRLLSVLTGLACLFADFSLQLLNIQSARFCLGVKTTKKYNWSFSIF